MMKQVHFSDIQEHLPSIIQQAFAGEGTIIVHNGMKVRIARIIPEKTAESVSSQANGAAKDVRKPYTRRIGGAKGMVKYMAEDFDAPLEDFKDYM